MTHPKADGLDALKREAVQWYKERFDRSDIIGMPSDREVLFDFIDHLAQRGLINCGWLPIESAPMDGTDILVYKDVASVPIVHIAFYRSAEEWERSGQYCGGWDSLHDWEGWWSYTENSISQSKLEGWKAPTHWMPLPAAPKMEDA